MKKIEPNNLGVYVCPHVFENTRPILYVCRADGDWQFLCGGTDHDENAHLVGVGHLTHRDPTLNALADLESDWEAERSAVGAEWIITKCKPET